MTILKCPKCGAEFELVPVEKLSPAARRILEYAPRPFLSGHRVELAAIAYTTGYSIGRVHSALQELVRGGYVEALPIGPKKCAYRGIPRHS